MDVSLHKKLKKAKINTLKGKVNFLQSDSDANADADI